MVWTAAVTDTFTRANTSPGGAGTTTGAGNGWIDAAGGIWNISGNTLLGTSNNGSGYLTQSLLRPVGEAVVSQRITATITAASTSGAAFAVGLRAANAGLQYIAQPLFAGSPKILLYVISGGNATGIGGSAGFTPVAGHVYTIDLSAVGINPTVLTATLHDDTANVVADTVTVNDSTAGLQVAGVPTAVIWGGPASTSFTNITTYTQVAGASFTLSPSTVTGLAANVAVTVAGTGTSFAGTPFSISGGFFGAITGQTVASGTSATVTVNPGQQGYGLLTVTDSGSGASATLTVAPPALGALKIGWIGDSITAGTNGNPVAQAVTTLTAAGYTVTSSNQAFSGTSSADWRVGGSFLAPALSAFATAGVTLVHIMLGTNDVRSPNFTTVPAYVAYMTGIVGALRAANIDVVISKPLWTAPNAGGLWPADSAATYQQYFAGLLALVDGVHVFLGDTGGYEYSYAQPAVFLEAGGIHPKDATQNNLLGQMWAAAIMQKYGAASSISTPAPVYVISQTINRFYDNDGET